ncbi:uncharacterized protein DUF5019 [Pontibacter mucosus]|uniref:Uncharacterized protein DUF5019 n=1 Tax=Pontibacter mucosus TaxID=1649266 RepID=A0A2T5YGJ6_9BACT|nr:SusF/SusE family outer membrane protein [Pontibacter mucosus]PTX18433.1 uncharacterized protein DUF5019 [Pontibacter mucosus]
MLKRTIFSKLLTLLALCSLTFATVSCEDEDWKSLDDLAVTINQITPDTVFFGNMYSVNVIANKASELRISLGQAGGGNSVFDTVITNPGGKFVFTKDIPVPESGEWDGDYTLKVSSGSIEKVKNVHFKEAPGFPTLWVPGSHQGWDPASAPKIISLGKDDKYEGYVNFPNSNTEFKFTSHPNWDNTNYGAGEGGALSTDGSAGNLTASEPGYYLLKADLNDNTWSATKTSWGVIGDATAGGWDSDQDLTYDAKDMVWKGTLTLKAGEIKFRANDGWDINLGDDGANGSLEYGGANIKIAAAGTYEIELNLSEAGNYTYTIK